jgi:hypothetical protein
MLKPLILGVLQTTSLIWDKPQGCTDYTNPKSSAYDRSVIFLSSVWMMCGKETFSHLVS